MNFLKKKTIYFFYYALAKYKIVTVHTEQCDQQHKIRIIEEENTQDNTQDGVGS